MLATLKIEGPDPSDFLAAKSLSSPLVESAEKSCQTCLGFSSLILQRTVGALCLPKCFDSIRINCHLILSLARLELVHLFRSHLFRLSCFSTLLEATACPFHLQTFGCPYRYN